MKRKLALFLLLSLLCAPGCVCAAQSAVSPAQKDVGSGFYFDTYVTFTLYGADTELIADLHRLCTRYESLLSKSQADSDVYRINHAQGQPVAVSHETWLILRRAKEISALTNHALSVTIAPVTELWDFTGGSHRIPDDGARLAALALVDDGQIALGEGDVVTLPAGMQIDLGGIAKGYIADRAAELVRGRCTGAILNLGGNVYCVGSKPDGSAFRVGIENPLLSGASVPAMVTIRDRTVVTSGTYERYFEKDGVRYHHILDPQTGISADTDLVSVTIVGVCSMDADAFATACIVLGKEQSLRLLEAQGIDAILIAQDGEIIMTPGFEEHVEYRPAK